jgi:hypothetical protein
MRTLILVPIAHKEKDLTSLFDRQFGSTEEVWDGIRRAIAHLQLPYSSVRLYQDALPLCGKEQDIVKEIAAGGSRNHRLLLDLMVQGARLVGTEDPELVLQEYQSLQSMSAGGRQASEEQQDDARQQLLSNRDQFIAGRINATLSTGEIGLLFLGLNHSPEPFLDADILLKRLSPVPRSAHAELQA